MADSEAVLQEPVATTTPGSAVAITGSKVDPNTGKTVTQASTASPAAALKKLADHHTAKVLPAINAAPTPKAKVTKTNAGLPEVQVEGWHLPAGKKNPESYPLICCIVDGHYIEKFAAYDFVLMREAALKDGIVLKISSAFRSMKEQKKLYAERLDPVMHDKYGPAAYPGTSNHQQGKALDIKVGMDYRTNNDKTQWTDTYIWLQAHASEFGYDNNEISTEPWHWRHNPDKIIGTSVPVDRLAQIVDTDGLAALIADGSTLSGETQLHRELYNQLQAARRTAIEMGTPRDTVLGQHGAAAVRRGAAAANKAGQITQAVAMARAPDNRHFARVEVSRSLFDFTTGKWLDQE